MNAIFRGQRCRVVALTDVGVWLEQVGASGDLRARVHVASTDPDLLLEPADEELRRAESYERGEIAAFDYPDGHSYPPR
jgi:hypothetical protein